MIKNILRFVILIALNYSVFFYSSLINAQQFISELNSIPLLRSLDQNSVYIFISIIISLVTLWFLYFFNPFIEVYLMYYLKFNFYFIINFVSLSSIYIAFRIYGYSRLYVLIYLFLASFSMLLSDRLKS